MIALHLAATVLMLSAPATRDGPAVPEVIVARVPEEGIQPQVACAPDGALHLVYYKGDAKAGDLFHTRRTPGEATFSAPVRVNSTPGSACAAGTIRGAQISLGRAGRLHVAWNGSSAVAAPAGPGHGQHPECPMLYTRSDPQTGRFEPQRSLMTSSHVLDGGGTVAADNAGGVIVAWHALPIDPAANGEAHRRVWLARSRDDGAAFAPEIAVDDRRGACACCGMVALAGDRSGVHLLYRAAADDGLDRGMALLSAAPGAAEFAASRVDEWRVQTCPMSSCALADAPDGRTVMAWENKGQVFVAGLDPGTGALSPPRTPPGETRTRKHPRIAVNSRGQTLLVWTEGTAWQKGGSIAWQVFDTSGDPIIAAQGKADGLPVWSFAAPAARPDGSFELFY